VTALREDQPTLSRPSKETNEAKKTDLPIWPQSSLSLALSALLVLIPPSQGPFSMTEASIVLRRTYAQLFAQAALASVEKEIDDMGPAIHFNSPGACLSQGHSPLHSRFMNTVSVVTSQGCEAGSIKLSLQPWICLFMSLARRLQKPSKHRDVRGG
jgi:hypothetical protein